MNIYLQIVVLMGGIYAVIFGLRVLFSPRFAEHMRKKYWHKAEYDRKVFGKWSRLDEVINVGFASIFSGVCILVFLYYMSVH